MGKGCINNSIAKDDEKSLYLQRCNKNQLTQTPFIKRLLAALMLMLFAFSITPKKILHDVFANHKDSLVKTVRGTDAAQLTVAGFNCHCDNLVAESPFTDEHTVFEIAAPLAFAEQKSAAIADFNSQSQFFFELRGPPSAI